MSHLQFALKMVRRAEIVNFFAFFWSDLVFHNKNTNDFVLCKSYKYCHFYGILGSASFSSYLSSLHKVKRNVLHFETYVNDFFIV